MQPTIPKNAKQRVDQVWRNGTLIEEFVWTYPEDGTGVRRVNGKPDELVTGLPVTVEKKSPEEIKDLAITIGFNQAFVDRPSVDAATLAAQVKNLTIQINRVLNFIKETQEGKQ